MNIKLASTGPARLPLIELDDGDAAGELAGAARALAAAGRRAENHHRVLANNPAALDAFLGLSRYVRSESQLSPRVRELAILATGLALGSDYVRSTHIEHALNAGVSPPELEALTEAGGSLATLSPVERSAVEYARQVGARRDVEDAVFEQLRSALSEPEVLDLALTVAWYHLCAALFGPLRVPALPAEGHA